MDRRNFIKYIGSAAALAMAGCSGQTENGVSDGNMNGKSSSSNNEEKGKMTYRVTPNTGDRVSILGYGCMRLPTKKGGKGNDEIDQEEVNRSVDYAIKHGVNYFDTSPAYCKGKSESAMGNALSRYPRDSYYIATKLSNFDESTWPREKSIEMYCNSLKYLQTDHIDYMLLHAIGMGGMEAYRKRYVDNGILDFLDEERKAGRIRNLGFSYHGDVEVFDYLLSLNDKYHWDFVQIQMNYIDWLHAKELNARNTNAEYLYNELQKRGIPVVIMEPLLGGRLATLNNNLTAKLKQQRPDDSIASWAFRFAGSPEGVLTVLSGMTYMEHLMDNVKTYSPLEPLSPEEKKLLGSVAVQFLHYPTVACTHCNYCMPCPYGLDIPGVFAHYNKCVNEGEMPEGVRDPAYEGLRKKYLAGYDRAVNPLRQANHCTGCRKCQEHCPQGINISQWMKHIEDVTESMRRGVELEESTRDKA